MNGIVLWLPWTLAAFGGLAFAYIAFRSGGSKFLWAIMGALWSLLLSTVLLGLADATTVPYSHSNYEHFQTLAAAASAFVLVATIVLAWFVSPYRAQMTA